MLLCLDGGVGVEIEAVDMVGVDGVRSCGLGLGSLSQLMWRAMYVLLAV